MKYIIATVLALVLCAASGAKAAPCTLTRATTVTMSPDPESGAIVVPITVNDQTLSFLADTGGLYSSLTDSAVDRLGLPRRMQTFTGEIMFGGKILDRYVVANHINFGGLNAHRFEFVVMPDDVLPKDVQGTLAPDVLGANDVDFDFAKNKFSLFSQEHCYGGVVYWTGGYFARIPFTINEYERHIQIEVMLDGKPARAVLDTGSSTSLMNLEAAQSAYGIDSKSLKLLSSKDSDSHRYAYPFKTLSFGDVTVTNPHIVLVPQGEAHTLGGTEPPIIIGMSILSKLHLYVAYGEKNLYITGADAH
ncbi:MAG: aspartyl protease family protein [Rhizomicrobium sp.]